MRVSSTPPPHHSPCIANGYHNERLSLYVAAASGGADYGRQSAGIVTRSPGWSAAGSTWLACCIRQTISRRSRLGSACSSAMVHRLSPHWASTMRGGRVGTSRSLPPSAGTAASVLATMQSAPQLDRPRRRFILVPFMQTGVLLTHDATRAFAIHTLDRRFSNGCLQKRSRRGTIQSEGDRGGR